MAISDKLTYLNETKSQLKDMINYGLPTEEQITSNTTFRNYVKSIFSAFLEALRNPDTLFTNLPKVSGTGANITLNDTANAPMRIELGASELTQDGTPTPDNPQDIHTISGSNKVVVSDGNGNSQEANIDLGNLEYCKIGNYQDRLFKSSGKNLFDKDNVSQGRLYENGTLAVMSGYFTSQFIKVEPNTQYTKNSPTADAFHRFAFYSSNTEASFISQSLDNTITTPSNCQYLRFCGIDTEVNTAMLEKGSTATYEPYGNYWYKYSAIGKVVLDGSENWIYDTAGGFNRFSTLLQDAFVGTGRQICLSNYFTNNLTTNADGICFIVNQNVYLYKNDTTTINDFKTWLSTHNTEVYYPLATPTYTPITGTLAEQLEYVYNQMLAYKGQTSISQENDDLPFDMVATALKDLSSL